jgi:hypothetical protein
MKTLHKLTVFLLLMVLMLAIPSSALAAGPNEEGQPDEFVFGGDYTLENGDTLRESLVVFGGSAEIELNATVQGDVVIMGGSLTCNGLIEGNVMIMGGTAELGATAVVEGDLVTLGGSLERAPGATVEGDVVGEIPGIFKFGTEIEPIVIPPFNSDFYNGISYIPPVWGGLWFLWVPFAMLTMAALAMIIVMFWPKPIERVARAAASQPLASGGMGLLTLIVLPFALLFMVLTCVLILAIPIVVIALGLATLLGWVALGLELGQRIAAALKQDWHPALAAGLGVFILTLVAAGVDQAFKIVWWLSCVGWVIPTVIGVVALGAALLTRFGTRDYPTPVAAPAPAAEPVAEALPPQPPAAELPSVEAPAEEPPATE